MCDYCDCRSHPEIAALSDDHERLLELLHGLRSISTGSDASGAAAHIAALHAVLEGHTAREERGVFAQLRDVVLDAEYVAMFEHDHEAVHRLLVECASDEWQRPAAELVDALHDHILREETDLFPAAHQMLAPAQWSAVDTAVSEIAKQEQRA